MGKNRKEDDFLPKNIGKVQQEINGTRENKEREGAAVREQLKICQNEKMAPGN